MRLAFSLIALLSLSACVRGRDEEMWFGKVAGKEHTDEPCSHTYCASERCTSTDDDGHCTSTTCDRYDTRHNRDLWWGFAYDWDLDGQPDRFTYDGDSENDGFLSKMSGRWVTLKDCGDCSLNAAEQQVWNGTKLGDDVAVPHIFENYLLVDRDSLILNETNYIPARPIPEYPHGYLFHRFNSAVNADGTKIDVVTWNAFLAHWNTHFGHSKQVHMMVVATYDPNPLYADALAQAWLLGKKNNAIFVFGLNPDDTIKWARLVSFSDLESMRRHVRDDFTGLHVNDQKTALLVKDLTHDYYQRDPMKDKEYLLRNSFWNRWGPGIAAIFAVIGAVVIGLLIKNGGYRSVYYSRIQQRQRWQRR